MFRDDGYCWSYTKTGLYTVKSGYKLANQMKEEKQESAVVEPSINPLKAMIWKLKAPRKMKHFLWQALSDCVTTCSRLSDRHCGTDRSCPRCGHEEESLNHLLFLCPPAFQTWALSDIPTILGTFPSESLYENFDYLLLRAKKIGALIFSLGFRGSSGSYGKLGMRRLSTANKFYLRTRYYTQLKRRRTGEWHK